MKFLFSLAVFGLATSALAHVSTFFGINPQRAFPPVFALHLLLFVVCVPAFFVPPKTAESRNVDRKDFWKVRTRHAPTWMKRLSIVLFVYAFFNFFAGLALTEGGVPEVREGQKVLHDHGRVIRVLTDEEYELHRAYVVRLFSGHWLAFYALGMTLLSSRFREESAPDEPVAPAAGTAPPGC